MATAKKKTQRRPGRPKGSKNVKKVARRKKKAGRPKRKKAAGNSISLPVDQDADLPFWSNMVAFLNANNKKSFTVLMDGSDYWMVSK